MQGFKGTVLIAFDGKLDELVDLISCKLDLPKFIFKTDDDPPYQICALSGTLGIDIWVSSSEKEDNAYECEIRSYVPPEYILGSSFFDLSEWLSYIFKSQCGLNVDWICT